MALLRVRFAPYPQPQKMGAARHFWCGEIERSLDKKDAEPPGDMPRGSGEEVFKFFKPGSGGSPARLRRPPFPVLGSGIDGGSDRKTGNSSGIAEFRQIRAVSGYLRRSGIGSRPQIRQRDPKNPAIAHSSQPSRRPSAIWSLRYWWLATAAVSSESKRTVPTQWVAHRGHWPTVPTSFWQPEHRPPDASLTPRASDQVNSEKYSWPATKPFRQRLQNSSSGATMRHIPHCNVAISTS